MKIQFKKRDVLKVKPAKTSALGFGKYFTDYMFSMDYEEGKGWHNPWITPYEPISVDPSIMVFHYAQAVFEGLKAYRHDDGSVALFRPELNFARLNQSNQRMVIPEVDVEFCVTALSELLKIERDWVPSGEGESLYIRPFIIATESHLGVHPASRYKFMIILSPSGAYYPQGLDPVSIYVEEKFVRSVQGGTGEVKAAANYAISLKAQELAEQKGFVQVLWLDGNSHRYVEEVGSMNVFFVIEGKIKTPSLSGTILPGITRRSVIDLAKFEGLEVEETSIDIYELFELAKQGRVTEAFGSGTAAVISPIGKMQFKDEGIEFKQGEIGEISQKFYDLLTGIQYGKIPDTHGWIRKI